MGKAKKVFHLSKPVRGFMFVIILCSSLLLISFMAIIFFLNQKNIIGVFFPESTPTPFPSATPAIINELPTPSITPTPTITTPETLEPEDNPFQNKLRTLGIQNDHLVVFTTTSNTLIGAFVLDADSGQIVISKTFQSGSQRNYSKVFVDQSNGDIYYTTITNAPKIAMYEDGEYDPCYYGDAKCDNIIWKGNILNNSKIQIYKSDYPFDMYFDRSVKAIYTQPSISSTISINKVNLRDNTSGPYIYLPYAEYGNIRGLFISDGAIYFVPEISNSFSVYMVDQTKSSNTQTGIFGPYDHYDKIFKIGTDIYLIGHDGHSSMYLYKPYPNTSKKINVNVDPSTNILTNSEYIYIDDEQNLINKCQINNVESCEKTTLNKYPVSVSYDNSFLIVADTDDSTNLTLLDLKQNKPTNLKGLIDLVYPGKGLGSINYQNSWFNQNNFVWFTIGKIS